MVRDRSSRSGRSRDSHTGSAETRRHHRDEGHQTQPSERRHYSRSSESGNYAPATAYSYHHYPTGEPYAYSSLEQDSYAGWNTTRYDGDDELSNVGPSSTRTGCFGGREEQTRSQYSSASSRRAGTSHSHETPSSTYGSSNTAARPPGWEVIPYQDPAARASSPSAASDSTLVIDVPRPTESRSDRQSRRRHRSRERPVYNDTSYTSSYSSNTFPSERSYRAPSEHSYTTPSDGRSHRTGSSSRQSDGDYSSYTPSSRRSNGGSASYVTTTRIYIPPLHPGETVTVNLPPRVLR